MIVTFKPSEKEFDLIAHVSNYTHSRGGLWFDIDFGTAEQIYSNDAFLKYKDGIVIGILSMMSVYFLCSLYLLKEARKNLSFMLMCLILIIRTSLYGDFLIVKLFPDIPFRLQMSLSYLTLFWFPVILYQMISYYFDQKSGISLVEPFYIYAAAVSALTILSPAYNFTACLPFFDGMALCIYISGLINVFRAHLKRVPSAGIILAGCIAVGITGFHDMLYQANLIRSPLGEIVPLGLIIFLLLLFLLMADRLARAYREVQFLSLELADKLKLEQDLTQRLYTLDNMKDEFLTNTSHELRAPLNGIINITQSVLQGIGGQISKVQRQNLEVILSSAKKLHIIINDLLDVSLLRSGGIQIKQRPLEIQTLISNMMVVFRHLKKNDSILLQNDIPSDFPLVYADEVRLRQILNNLIGNALKYTSYGSINISASHDGEKALICVEDTGIGITPERLANIFNAFEQVDGTLQRRYSDFGQGLYITRLLVELHGGRIWITSEPGQGSQVFFTIPLCADQEISNLSSVFKSTEVEGIQDFLDPDLEDRELPYNILAVDDDASNLRVMTNILRLANYHVRCVSSGKEALGLLENGIPFELVILNVMVSELSGFEILEALRGKYTRMELPVLMLTSKSQSEAISLCFKLGANDYLTKPFEVDELLARVNNLVKLKHAVNKLVNTEMSFLQAQIKPHFIHNALSVISSLSIKNPPKAKSLILDLSDYLRGSFELNNDDGLTTLSKELDLIRAYLSIEQARFKERLQIHYHLQEDIDCTLPLLTIQPLVENAIRHGILCRLEGGEVHLTTSLEADRVRIEVRDNGVGMTQEQIERFFAQKPDQRGIGMANIHRRLISFYGEGLHIESVRGCGTVIYFYIPYRTGQQQQE